MAVSILAFILAFFVLSVSVSATVCQGFGPQTPRDISNKQGDNPVIFNYAPSYQKMNLCNIHFHKNAEHKGPGFSIHGGEGKYGGFKCNNSSRLSDKELSEPKIVGCENILPGDTIEIHWVHSSCSVRPGSGLSSCLSDSCGNPQLRVEAQVYLLLNDENATDLDKLDVLPNKKHGFYQAKKIPTKKDAVRFLGSTTGPSYSELNCSPLQVTWNVSPTCEKMNINSVHRWCQKNSFSEKKAHGVRKLVTTKELLAEIQ